MFGFIHILVRLFIVLSPFIGNDYFLTLHLMIIPFIMLHWATNQTVCALTELEKLYSNKKEEDTFFGQVFTPIYKNESFVGVLLKPFYTVEDKDEEKLFVWIGLTLLWLITLYKLDQSGFSYLYSQFHSLSSSS